MTIEQLFQWIKEPQTTNKEQVADLRKLCEEFPYFPISRMLLLKALRNSSDVLFETEIRKTSTYCSDRRKLFFLLYPTTDVQSETTEISQPHFNDLSGDYFTLEAINEPKDQSQSLKSLAQKLKDARLQKAQRRTEIAAAPVPQPESKPLTIPIAEEATIYTEEEAIRLIRAKNFEKALKILRVLHLNIPEKSVYFADQIRYLEKIIATLNKS